MDIKDVEDLAELARLDLKEEEKQTLIKDLDGVLTYVKIIEQAVADDVKVEPEIYNVWREDEVIHDDSVVDLIKQQFPASQDGFLKVKKIL